MSEETPTVYSIGERDIRSEGSTECEWCGATVTENVVTVVETSTGDRDTCLDCREEQPWRDDR